MALILTETRGRVGLITLNRPEALNALNAALIDDLVAAVGAYRTAAACAVENNLAMSAVGDEQVRPAACVRSVSDPFPACNQPALTARCRKGSGDKPDVNHKDSERNERRSILRN